MSSYENDLREKAKNDGELPDRLDIGILKYLWQSNPLSLSKQESIPKFLSNISFLNTFTDNEIRIFSKFLHVRNFKSHEIIFHQGDVGYGFYFIFAGSIGIELKHKNSSGIEAVEKVAKLGKSEYFGEMGLLEDFNRRSAAAVANEPTLLLGLFKPDLEELMSNYPVVGAKFLREISLVLAHRVGSLMNDLTATKNELQHLKQEQQK